MKSSPSLQRGFSTHVPSEQPCPCGQSLFEQQVFALTHLPLQVFCGQTQVPSTQTLSDEQRIVAQGFTVSCESALSLLNEKFAVGTVLSGV